MPCHTAELNTARTAALDYLRRRRGSRASSGGRSRSGWRRRRSEWLKLACKDLAFPADHHSLANYISDTRGLLIKNFPEFHACAARNSANRRNSGAILAQFWRNSLAQFCAIL